MRSSALIAVLASITLGSILPARPARAQDEDEERKKQFIVRPEVFERLQRAQKALEQDQFEEAKKQLRIIDKRMNPNDHERALSLQVLGYVYAAQEKLVAAARTLEEALSLNALPDATELSMMFSAGQIYLAAKKYPESIRLLDAWVQKAEKPTPSALYTVAAAKYQAKDMRGAARFAARAVREAKDPKDSWLQLQLSAHIELKEWRRAIEVMKTLVERHPDRRNNWLQLVAMYGEIDDEARALAVMQLAHRAGVFDAKNDYVQLAQRLQSSDNHYRAAKVLEQAVEKGKIERDAEIAEMIGTSWFVAREHEEARTALARAASMAEDGELYLRLAQLNVEREKWGEAVAAGRKALAKGGLKSPGKVQLLIGIAEARRGRMGSAKKAFAAAARSPDTRRSAEGWMKYLSSAGTPVTGAGSGTSPE